MVRTQPPGWPRWSRGWPRRDLLRRLLLIIFFVGARPRASCRSPLATTRLPRARPSSSLAYRPRASRPSRRPAAASRTPTARSSSASPTTRGSSPTPDNRTFLINTVAVDHHRADLSRPALGLTLALLLDRMSRESISKSLIFMPMAISFVGAGIIWGLVYEYRDPARARRSACSARSSMWLGWTTRRTGCCAQPWNNFLLMVIMIWIQVGFAMVVLSAAIKAIPSDVVEAADARRRHRLEALQQGHRSR